MITQIELRERLRYDPETGDFVWLDTPLNKYMRATVTKAGHLKPSGYWTVRVMGRAYYRSRLAWLYMTGEWPEEVDHINLDPSDDRFCNLRNVGREVNTANTKTRKDNKIGLKGVRLHRMGKYDARIQYHKKSILLGYFETAEKASAAYIAASMKLRGHAP